jgi:hypothetical protein
MVGLDPWTGEPMGDGRTSNWQWQRPPLWQRSGFWTIVAGLAVIIAFALVVASAS